MVFQEAKEWKEESWSAELQVPLLKLELKSGTEVPHSERKKDRPVGRSLRKEDGRSKIYNQEIDNVDYLD